MDLLKKFFTQSNVKSDTKPLHFSFLAIQKINQHLSTRPTDIHSAFQVKVLYKPEKYIVQVGFNEYVQHKNIFKYPVELMVSGKDELFLRGFEIDYHEDEAAFFVYPNIEVEAIDTPRRNIVKFIINRHIISPNSPTSELVIEKNGYTKRKDLHLLNTIFSKDFVESIFAKENWIQVEFSPRVSLRESETKIGEALVEYFESCSYPLIIEKNQIYPEFLV